MDDDPDFYGGDEPGEVDDEALMAAQALNERLKSLLLEQEQQARQPERRALGGGTAGPNTAGANKGKGGWGGTTHTKARQAQIDLANAHLVSRITNVSSNPTGPGAARKPVKIRSSSGINRRARAPHSAHDSSTCHRASTACPQAAGER